MGRIGSVSPFVIRNAFIAIVLVYYLRKKSSPSLGYNDFGFQHIKAETCGFYAVGLLIHIQNNPNMDLYDASFDYIKMFAYDTKDNNHILKAYFRSLPKSKGFKLLDKLYSEK
jgi:hypothetical protein